MKVYASFVMAFLNLVLGNLARTVGLSFGKFFDGLPYVYHVPVIVFVASCLFLCIFAHYGYEISAFWRFIRVKPTDRKVTKYEKVDKKSVKD